MVFKIKKSTLERRKELQRAKKKRNKRIHARRNKQNIAPVVFDKDYLENHLLK